ncbi:MAG: hypothetical protein NTV87_18075 [Ignavibacteriae bacterium]|nr:hypothetical protein [Ignavibacteriota bacterium]
MYDYSNIGNTKQPKKSNSCLITGIIVGIVIVIFICLGIAGYFGYKYYKDSEITKPTTIEEVKKNKDNPKDIKKEVTEDIQNDEINYNSSEKFPGAKLYFCERYDPVDGEISVSKKFSTGYLTVMVDLRPSGKEIGMTKVFIKLTKIKDAGGNRINEKTMKTIPFTIQSSFDYIYFENKKDLKFSSPGTYKVTLTDKNGDSLVSGEVVITD